MYLSSSTVSVRKNRGGVDTQGGVVNGGWGVGWTVDLKLNRKKN